MTETIIEVIKDKSIITGADHHICQITGERYTRKPTYYRNTETGTEYYHISGSICWPGQNPGFIVIIAVLKTTENSPVFQVIEEVEIDNINGLLSACLQLREKYGHGQGSDLFNFWYGENDRFDAIVNDFNHYLTARDDKTQGIYLVPPYDHQKPNAFEIWVNSIRGCLKRDASNKPTLYMGNCTRLRSYIQTSPFDVAVKGSIEDYPALAALGGVVHSLMMLRPCLEFARPERVTPTMHDPVADLQEAQERALWEMENGIYGSGEFDEYDDGELVSTL
jgi:hypothetical protein